jgi:hypothetical protein
MAGLQIPSTARNRLELIEEMIADGRRTTEGWGGPLVLWGIGHLAGFAGNRWFHAYKAWLVIVPICFVASLVLLGRGSADKRTFAGRAVHAVWSAEMVGLSILDLIAVPSGRIGSDGYDLFFLCSMGTCMYVNGVVLRWPMCKWIGAVWWGAVLLGLALPAPWMGWIWLAATAVLQLGFGFYLVVRDRRSVVRDRGRAGEEA